MSMVRWAVVFIMSLPLFAQTPLSQIRKICVDKISGPEALAATARELAFTSLFAAKKFAVMEKCEKAEAALKGAVLETAERKTRGESEGIGFGAVAGGASSSGAAIAGIGGSNGESLGSSEVRRQATLALRLVDGEGMVLWAFAQDSVGGKTKTPIADAMERAIRQLLKDLSKDNSGVPQPLSSAIAVKP